MWTLIFCSKEMTTSGRGVEEDILMRILNVTIPQMYTSTHIDISFYHSNIRNSNDKNNQGYLNLYLQKVCIQDLRLENPMHTMSLISKINAA